MWKGQETKTKTFVICDLGKKQEKTGEKLSKKKEESFESRKGKEKEEAMGS